MSASLRAASGRAVVVDAFDRHTGFTEWLQSRGFSASRPLFRMRRAARHGGRTGSGEPHGRVRRARDPGSRVRVRTSQWKHARIASMDDGLRRPRDRTVGRGRRDRADARRWSSTTSASSTAAAAPPIENGRIVIERDRIARVGPAATIGGAGRRRDGRPLRPHRDPRPHRFALPHRERSEAGAAAAQSWRHGVSRSGPVGREVRRAAAHDRGGRHPRAADLHDRAAHRRRESGVPGRLRGRARRGGSAASRGSCRSSAERPR